MTGSRIEGKGEDSLEANVNKGVEGNKMFRKEENTIECLIINISTFYFNGAKDKSGTLKKNITSRNNFALNALSLKIRIEEISNEG